MAPVSPRRSARAMAGAAMLVALATAGSARADDAPASPGATPPSPEAPPRATRRSGFWVGIDVGAGVGSIVGYPNDVTKIGYASAYHATGVRPVSLGELWIGGALTDWVNFGVGVTSSMMLGLGDDKARLTGVVFRTEAFPLFALGGPLRDLGVRFDAGLGTATVTDPAGALLVDSSSASMIGGGVFWEGLRAWKTAHGPMLVGNYLWSDSARRPAIFLGWRSVLYTGP